MWVEVDTIQAQITDMRDQMRLDNAYMAADLANAELLSLMNRADYHTIEIQQLGEHKANLERDRDAGTGGLDGPIQEKDQEIAGW